MRALVGAVVVVVLGLHVALAAPRKVLVLPLDGNVDPATRARLNAGVQRLARSVDGTVSIGDTTFDETSAALGCDPEAPACAEAVRTTLGVDELIYGKATTAEGKTTLVVHRIRSKTAYRDGAVTFGADEPPPQADATVDRELSPLFDVQPQALPPDPVAPPPVTPPPAAGLHDEPHSPRLRGILITTGGGAAIVVGLVLWANVASTQSDIDDADPRNANDFAALEDQEAKAQRNAIIGDVLVVAGVGLAAWGAYTIYRSGRTQVTVAPQATATSAGVAIGGRW